MPETRIVSFVVRFVQQENDPNQPPWRGLIRHVQSRQELHFHLLPDALQFMGRYVDLAGAGLAGSGRSPDPDNASKPQPDSDD